MAKEVSKAVKKDFPTYARALMALSFVSFLLSGLGFLGTDIVLASTQWLLLGTFLGVWGVYFKLEA